jgi:hypothetical protein
MLDGGAVDWTGTGLELYWLQWPVFRCIDDVAVEAVDVPRANQRGAGASLHALDCEAVKGGERSRD